MYQEQLVPEFRGIRNEYASIYKTMTSISVIIAFGGISSLIFEQHLPVIGIGVVTTSLLQLLIMQLNMWQSAPEINAYRKELRFKTTPFTPFKRISWEEVDEIIASKTILFVALKCGKIHTFNTHKAPAISTHLQHYLIG